MKTKKFIITTIHEYLNNQILKENISNRYILLPYSEDNGGDFEEEEYYDKYDIDKYEAANRAVEIAIDGGISILRNKNLHGILIDINNSRIIGAIWISNSSDEFSFDIAIDGSYQNMGLSSILIDSAIDEYRNQKDMYDDMGDNDFKMEVDVINPKLAQILKNKYNFYVIGELSQHRVLMSMD